MKVIAIELLPVKESVPCEKSNMQADSKSKYYR